MRGKPSSSTRSSARSCISVGAISSINAGWAENGFKEKAARRALEWLQGDLIAASQYLKGVYRKAGEEHFMRSASNRMRGNGFKLKKGRFRLDIRKKFFTVRVARHWNRLPREVVDALSLDMFKTRLDGALSNLV